MSKKYWEMYEEITKMRPRTLKYYKAVSQALDVKINKELLNDIREIRKTDAYKQGKTFSQAFDEYNKGVKYENYVIERAYKIWTGEYLKEKNEQYANNFISALKNNNISTDIVEYLENHREILAQGMLPDIREFYVPSKGSGSKYSLNIDYTDFYNLTIRETLVNMYGAKVADVYDDKGIKIGEKIIND